MHIVCHMAASVDGRLRPSRWSPFVEDCSVGGVYEEVANQYDYVGWMIGRVTMAEYSEAITESEPAKLRPAEAAPAHFGCVRLQGQASLWSARAGNGRTDRDGGERPRLRRIC